MKSKLLLTLASIAVMLASCNQEEVAGPGNSPTTTRSFTVNVDDGVNTRAVTPLAVAPTRYVMEVYKGATAAGTPVSHTEQATGTFTGVVLDNAQEYTVLFWADNGTPSTDGTHNEANEYNAADLKAAKIAKQPNAAAYSGVSKFTVGTTEESVYTNVTLKHGVAQVNFVQTEKLTSATNSLKVTYPESYSLNVGDNAVTKIEGVVTHNFTYNSDAASTLGTSYIIAATGGSKTVMEIKAQLNSEAEITVSNVPFERNYKTNLSGAYSSKYAATLTVTCDDAWGSPDNEQGIVIPITWAKGNLVADGDHGAKIGEPTDGGLYFQFGSLLGWAGGVNGDGTGEASGKISVSLKVTPNGYEGSTTWNKLWTGDPTTADVSAGKGDPCKYYLKGTWRLPTKEEYIELFNNNTTNEWSNSPDWSYSSSAATNEKLELAFPTSGKRVNSDLGSVQQNELFGYGWSGTPGSSSGTGFALQFYNESLFLTKYLSQGSGFPVRCVK